MAIAAIETRYGGCRFRSRLEARWAVFFDRLGIPWEYEPEGFDTPAGRYLPDFYLPSHARWIEIKGGSFTRRDRDRAAYFAESRWQVSEGYRVLIGDIPRKTFRAFDRPSIMCMAWCMQWIPLKPPYPPAEKVSVRTPDGQHFLTPMFGMSQGSALGPGTHLDLEIPDGARAFQQTAWCLNATTGAVDEALTAARSARFEHGENG